MIASLNPIVVMKSLKIIALAIAVKPHILEVVVYFYIKSSNSSENWSYKNIYARYLLSSSFTNKLSYIKSLTYFIFINKFL